MADGRGMDQASLVEIARIIRQIAKDDDRIFFRHHAREKMRSRQILETDVQHALRGCSVIRMEAHGFDNWRYICSGRTVEGEVLEMPVQVGLLREQQQPFIDVVTVFDPIKGGWGS